MARRLDDRIPGRTGPTGGVPSGTQLGGRGFTLIEVMVALVVAGLLAGAMISLLMGQSLFYAKNEEGITAQQNIRAAVDLLSSDLRMAASADIVVASPDSVLLRSNYLRAVVCDTTASGSVRLFVFDSIGNAGLSGRLSGTAYSDPYVAAFLYADGFTPSVSSTGGSPRAACTANGAPSDGSDVAYRETTGWAAAFGSAPRRGSIVRQYGLLAYRFAESDFASGRALWRNDRELVGPFSEDAVLSYVMRDGSVQSTVTGVMLDSIRAVRLRATTEDTDTRFEVERSFDFDVELRN